MIDHFFLNQELLDLVDDAGPVHLGDNLSRHSPIMMKLRLPEVAYWKNKEPRVNKQRHPAWFKATQADKELYTYILEEKLLKLKYSILTFMFPT